MNEQDIQSELDRIGWHLREGPPIAPRVLEKIRDLPMDGRVSVLNQLQLRRWIMRVTLGLAACAALAFGLMSLFSPPAAAWADVLTNISQTHSLTFDIVDDAKTTAHVSIKGSHLRADLPPDKVTLMDRVSGKVLMLDNGAKRATTMNFDSSHLDFYAMLAQFKDGKEQQLADGVLNGKSVHVYSIVRPLGPGDKNVTLTLWIDPATNLPVQVQNADDTFHWLMTHFDFKPDLADGLFDMTVPGGYATTDMGGVSSEQLKAPTTQQAGDLMLIPGQGIGSLKFRDMPEKVIAALGQPEKTLGSDYQFPSRGLYLMVNPKQGLLIITAWSKKAAGPFAVNDFPGKTDKGIAIGATRAQIEAAYGKPSREQNLNGTLDLNYDALGLDFLLTGDEVVKMVLMVHR